MSTAVAGVWVPANERMTPSFFVVCSAFLAGSLAGMFLALRSAGGDAAWSAYLDQLLELASEGSLAAPSGLSAFLGCFGWLFAVVLVGCTRFGLLGVPAVVLARGILLAFSAASFARAFSGLGLEVAFLLMGLPALLTVPALLLLGAQCFADGWLLWGRRGSGRIFISRIYWSRAAVCAGVSLLNAVLEVGVCPALLMGVSGTITQ